MEILVSKYVYQGLTKLKLVYNMLLTLGTICIHALM